MAVLVVGPLLVRLVAPDDATGVLPLLAPDHAGFGAATRLLAGRPTRIPTPVAPALPVDEFSRAA